MNLLNPAHHIFSGKTTFHTEFDLRMLILFGIFMLAPCIQIDLSKCVLSTGQ